MTTTQEWAEVTAQAADVAIDAEMRAAQLAMPPRKFDEVLPCKLSDEELLERGAELAKVLDTIDAIDVEKKAAVDQFKARIQIQESRARELRTAIESKCEDRPVECVESFELRLGVARTTRVDTGEMIRERALRSSELQPSLPGTERPTATSFEDDIEPSDGDVTVIEEPEAMLADSAEEPEARGSKRKKRGS